MSSKKVQLEVRNVKISNLIIYAYESVIHVKVNKLCLIVSLSQAYCITCVILKWFGALLLPMNFLSMLKNL